MNEELNQLLEKLHKEIEAAQDVDEKGKELLRALSADVRDLLERAEGKQPASMLERVRRAIEHFETSHPDLTAALSNLSAILSNAGI